MNANAKYAVKFAMSNIIGLDVNAKFVIQLVIKNMIGTVANVSGAMKYVTNNVIMFKKFMIIHGLPNLADIQTEQ